MRKIAISFVLFMGVFIAAQVGAHSGSTAFMALNAEENHIAGEWLVALVDLQSAVHMDVNYDDKLSYREFHNKRGAIQSYMSKHLFFSRAEMPCAIDWSGLSLATFNGGMFVKSSFKVYCSTALTMNYTALFDINSSHRAVVKLTAGADERTLLVTPQAKQMPLDFNNASFFDNIANYLKMGVVHILEGLDHLFFLVALLIPAVFSINNRSKNLSVSSGGIGNGGIDNGGANKSAAAQSAGLTNSALFVKNVKLTFFSLLKIVTAFTLGHSVTLICASIFAISPPGSFVEAIIALSVILAGANIMFKMFSESSWKVAALFGLVHGFGFAGALVDMGLNKNHLIASLFSFNLGVELGQVLIVLLVAPLLMLLAQRRWSLKLAQVASGLVIVSFGTIWLIERVPVGSVL